MPQGYITKIDPVAKRGTVHSQGVDYVFRQWSIGPESGGNWPRIGDYVQFGMTNGRLTDVRVITPPTVVNVQQKYVPPPEGVTSPDSHGGLRRLEYGDAVTTLTRTTAVDFDKEP